MLGWGQLQLHNCGRTQTTHQQANTCPGTGWAPTLPNSKATQVLGHPGLHSQLCQEMSPLTSGLTPALGPLGPAAKPCQWASTSSKTWLHPLVGGYQPQDVLDSNFTHQ